MTAQIPDQVIYEDNEYYLVGIDGGDLLTPNDFGMKPEMMHTACYRGYYGEYSCLDSRLFLTKMTVRSKNGYPLIDNVHPVLDEHRGEIAVYSDLRVGVPFSGGLLIVKELIDRRYGRMGTQHPYFFQIVIELELEDGYILKAIDHSEEMTHIRAEMEKVRIQQSEPGQPMPSRAELEQWMKAAFSREYDFDFSRGLRKSPPI